MVKKRKDSRQVIKLKTIIAVLIVIIATLLVVLAFTISDSSDLNEEQDSVQMLISGEPGVLGRACGILTIRKAQEIIGDDNLRAEYSNYPSKNRVTNGDDLHWSDSCRYVSKENSTKYVELFIDTYTSEKAAKLDLKDALPIVAISTEPAENFDELYYSAGAWFARKNKMIIKVSANDGSSGDLKNYSRSIFDEFYKDIEF